MFTKQTCDTLGEVLRRGLRMAVVGDRLRCWPAAQLTDDLRRRIAENRAEFMAWTLWASWAPDRVGFWARCTAALLAGVADDDERAGLRERFEHRAGVCEFDGGLSRDEAERLAFAEVWAARAAAQGVDSSLAGENRP